MARRVPLLAFSAALLACGESGLSPVPGEPPYAPPPETCAPVDLNSPAEFSECSLGSGIFGRFTLDERKVPAYEYGLDQHADERARFFNSEGLDRRDHWGAFGNSRINAWLVNDGYVEVTTQDRGPTYLNKHEPEQGNYAGGFSYLDDGQATWSTAYAERPEGAETKRVFGIGYGQQTTTFRGVRVERTTFCPPGDAPFVIDQVELTNTEDAAKTVSHYEVWDVGRRPIEINWAVSGTPLTALPTSAANARDERNGLFDEQPFFDRSAAAVGVERQWTAEVDAPSIDAPDPVDYYPGNPQLLTLVGPVDGVYFDQATFFGAGGVARPDAVTARAPSEEPGPARNGLGQPHVLVVRSDVSLPPNSSQILRFAYGYTPFGAPTVLAIDPALRDPYADLVAGAQADLLAHAPAFASDAAPELQREMAWHATQMEVSVGVRDYWQGHVVPQGSAYLYLHGADGAARDLGLFALPLVYTHPELAREELALYMGVHYAEDRRFSYAFQGHGMLDDALGIHTAPSDLDLFFLWALSEYVGATGDLAFLDATMPYYPREARPDATTWDHLHDALRHLFDDVGTGEHGLVRVGTGDWSDGIVFEAPDRDLAIANGESVPNTQMAVTILPRVADLVEARDPALAAEVRARVDAYRAAVLATFTGNFYGRAYFGDGVLRYTDVVNLEAQVWALVGDIFASKEDRLRVIATLADELDAPSPAGATLTRGGQVWPAISALYTWGLAQSDPDLAFAHFQKNTMVGHARAYPEVWYGIWSGPDGLNGPEGDRPGQSWLSPVTPMVDFPTQNNNQHALPLFAMLKMVGVEASAAGLTLVPRIQGERLSLRTALVDVNEREGSLEVAYRPTSDRVLILTPRAGRTIQAATIDGKVVEIPQGAEQAPFALTAPGGRETRATIYTK